MGLIFDGVDIEAEYSIVVDGAETWSKPERDRELTHVPGRSGDLIHDNGSWHNVEITYHCLIEHEFADRFDAFCDWLYAHLGYFRFEDQLRHPGVYRIAEFAGPLEPETIFRDHAGQFDLKFNCKPQQWLTSGEDEVALTYATWVKGYWHYWSAGGNSGFEFVETTGNGGISTPLIDITQSDLEAPWPVLRVVVPTDMSLVDHEDILVCLDENLNLIEGENLGGHSFVLDDATYLYQYHRDSSHTWPTGTKYVQMSAHREDGISHVEIAYALVEYEEAIKEYLPHPDEHYPDSEVDPREWSVYTERSEFIYNETNYKARPIIEIDAPSGVNFIINNFTVAIEETDIDMLVIDCELEDCYSYDSNGEVVNQNGIVSISCSDDRELSDFPYIVPGENYFKALLNEETARAGSDIVSSIRMKPNWYRI